MPTFYAHRNATSSIGNPWGWVTRDLAAEGRALGFWQWRQPEPGCCPGAIVEEYVDGQHYTPAGRVPDVRWRVVAPGGFATRRTVLSSIPTESTARELLAWLCPPQE